jgi:hypothetical protein
LRQLVIARSEATKQSGPRKDCLRGPGLLGFARNDGVSDIELV